MLLTLVEAAEKLRTTPGAARGVLDRLKVKPFNLGRGRGLGLRWKSEEIDAALERSREPRQRPKPAPRVAAQLRIGAGKLRQGRPLHNSASSHTFQFGHDTTVRAPL